MNNNFDNAVIYRIRCLDPKIETCYVGSTIDLKKRIRHHKRQDKKINKMYEFIDNNKGWNNFEFKVIEDASYVNNRFDLLWRERYYYDKLKPILNSIPPISSREEKLEKRKTSDKKYYYKNRERILMRNSDSSFTCECGSTITKNSYNRHCLTKKHQNYLNAKKNLELIIEENKNEIPIDL